MRASAGGGPLQQQLLYETKVGFRVHADGVEVGGLNVERYAVLQITQLLQTLGVLQHAGGQGREEIERGLAIGVQADVFPVGGRGIGRVAVIRDGGAGEVERAPVGGGDNFYGVGVGDVFRSAGDLDRGDIDVREREGPEQCGDVVRAQQGFIALDVDVDVGVVGLRDRVQAIGAAGQRRRGELDGDVQAAAEGSRLLPSRWRPESGRVAGRLGRLPPPRRAAVCRR